MCQAQLAVGGNGPLQKEVLISREIYECLPTAFSVLNAVGVLVPMTIGEVDNELEALVAGGHYLAADDDNGEGVDVVAEGDSDGGPVE